MSKLFPQLQLSNQKIAFWLFQHFHQKDDIKENMAEHVTADTYRN